MGIQISKSFIGLYLIWIFYPLYYLINKASGGNVKDAKAQKSSANKGNAIVSMAIGLSFFTVFANIIGLIPAVILLIIVSVLLFMLMLVSR